MTQSSSIASSAPSRTEIGRMKMMPMTEMITPTISVTQTIMVK